MRPIPFPFIKLSNILLLTAPFAGCWLLYYSSRIIAAGSERVTVLMDTAPVGLEADTMRLNRLADMALLVVRFDGVTLKSIQNALGRLNKSGVHILGCVVNCVKNSSSIPVCRSQRRASRAKTGREQNRSGQSKKTEPASSSSGSSGAP